MPGPLRLTTWPGTNGAGIGLPMAAPLPPAPAHCQAQPGLCLPWRTRSFS